MVKAGGDLGVRSRSAMLDNSCRFVLNSFFAPIAF